MNDFVGYIYFDRTRNWESHFSTNAHWADGDEDWFLGGTVRTLNDIYTILENQGFDGEYICNFINCDLSHDEYMHLFNKG
jgi:hypothetical protein